MKTRKSVGFIGGKFLPLHLGHIYAITSASNFVDELYVVLSHSKNRDSYLCNRDGIRYMSKDVRLSWLGKSFNDYENIKIVDVEDNQGVDDYDWDAGSNLIKKAIGKSIDYVFSSEPSYEEFFKKHYPSAKHIIVDSAREKYNVSGTDLRKNIYEHWDMLPDSVKPFFTKRVVVIGTESCGKSTLVKKLARVYNTEYVHEVGRNYCVDFSNQLTPDMFNLIAMEHYLLQEKKVSKSNKVLFVDSEATITKYYLDMYFGNSNSAFIDEVVKFQKYDLAIFLEPDVAWVSDGLRFAGANEIRYNNNVRLKKMFDEVRINYVSVTGNYNERFLKAKGLVDKLFEVKI